MKRVVMGAIWGPRCRTGLELPSRDNVVSEQGPRRFESRQVPQRDRGRQGADGDKGVARIGWGRMSGLNGTEVDKGFSIPHRTRKGSIRGTSAAYHATAGMRLASNMMNLGKGILEDVCVRKWVSVLANWWPTCCLSVCVGRAQQMVCGLLCARECDQVAQGSDANARKRRRLRDWVGENVTVRKFPTPILGSWQGRHKLSLAL
ncbi:hypothetical protein GH714_033925 [Hevea brasiliensis]|uniref:Uncharacterized protein n=1 Tax=Hevea brasiliensis TaxID=3981 RepID=A0A6A6L5P1_HEVBR|nr:hypothetical protein GH714_033925 [Hevea brasiliensis]